MPKKSVTNTTSRVRQVTDEKQQTTTYTYNLDNTIRAIGYGDTTVPTPNVSFTYDPNYRRLAAMKDGVGTTTYSYVPITAPLALGAGKLARTDGPLTNESITYTYDELGRPVQTTLDGVASTKAFDTAGRLIGDSNVLGAFAYGYDGASQRVTSESFPERTVSDGDFWR